MNIYEFTYEETDWVFAPNKKEAIDFYNGLTGINAIDEGYEVSRVPKSKWASMTIIDPEETDEEGNYKIIMTFKQYAEENTDTDIIATTAW